ncbi:MAG TPA: dihydroxyacetone kinase subunit DhaL [Spirochaetia bacterium]|nr:dihydroxyacetone kinase subunit DhaL [Spirochaetia bacterium]
MLSLEQARKWLEALTAVYTRQKEYLTELDSAIGDADHGVNMARGFSAVADEVQKQNPQTISALMKLVSMTLIRTVGGASGPLYGTFFLRFSQATDGKDALSTSDVLHALDEGVKGILQRGKAQVGDKTMVDAWTPAMKRLNELASSDMPLSEIMQNVTKAAEEGMLSTIPLVAKRGRASYLGERSKDHQDPGATSTVYMLQAAADTW